MRLQDKVAIITGGAKGLGGEMAQTFAKEGAKVIAVDMAPLTYECENVEFYQLNVTDGEACRALFEYPLQHLHQLLRDHVLHLRDHVRSHGPSSEEEREAGC